MNANGEPSNNKTNQDSETETNWYVGPECNVSSSLDDYDWYMNIYNNPNNVHLEGYGSTGRIIPKDIIE